MTRPQHTVIPRRDIRTSFAIRDRTGRVRLQGSAEDPMYWYIRWLEDEGAKHIHLQEQDVPGGRQWTHPLGRLEVADQ